MLVWLARWWWLPPAAAWSPVVRPARPVGRACRCGGLPVRRGAGGGRRWWWCWWWWSISLRASPCSVFPRRFCARGLRPRPQNRRGGCVKLLRFCYVFVAFLLRRVCHFVTLCDYQFVASVMVSCYIVMLELSSCHAFMSIILCSFAPENLKN